ncbi:MAG TPA: acireductone synthase [Allosphingosinicella sp.]
MTDAPKAILLDIEGTTSSLSFVADTLFPFARKHLAAYVAANPEAVAPILADVPGDDPVATLLQWMDEDRKATPLKTIQGMIWAVGFANGDLDGHVYPDTPGAMRRWRDRGIGVHIYSSGSIEAQKLIFGNSLAGDLTPLLGRYFDTTTGPKRAPDSYRKIAAALGLPPEDVLFVSDVQAEIDAARAAGMAAMLIDREGDAGEVSSLAEVVP